MEVWHERLIRKLNSTGDLPEHEAAPLRRLSPAIESFDPDTEFVREGERLSASCLVVSGLVARQKTAADGRRRIMSIHTPGDIVGLHSMHLQVMDHALALVGAGVVAFLPHADMRRVLRKHPALAEALWRDAGIDAAIHREWILNVGARSAYQRTAHLLCEIFLKIRAAGLAADGRCAFPLKQSDLADCLALSLVHVNRSLQQLRATKLIVLERKMLTVPDLAALKAAGEFDATYLHLRREAA